MRQSASEQRPGRDPAGKGLLLLSQLALEEKLPTNAVAQQLLTNLLAYGAGYKLTYRPVTFAPSAEATQSGCCRKRWTRSA